MTDNVIVNIPRAGASAESFEGAVYLCRPSRCQGSDVLFFGVVLVIAGMLLRGVGVKVERPVDERP